MITSSIITMPLWLTWEKIPPIGLAAATLTIGYILFEIGFFYHYHWHLIPRANQASHRPPAPYRDYMDIKDREKLLIRIIDRLTERITENDDGNNNNQNTAACVYKFIQSWFQKKTEDVPYDRFSQKFDMATLDVGLGPPTPAIIKMAWSSLGGGNEESDEASHMLDGEGSLDKDSSDAMQINGYNYSKATRSSQHKNTKKSSSGRLQRGNMDEFFSWAFFGVPFAEVQSSPEMQTALDNLYTILETKAGLTFETGTNQNYKPRSFTFEKVNSLYRPYAVYAGVAMMRMTANCLLFTLGFRQYTCKRGLMYWHRPANKTQQQGSPFLFFHGIAPGGHAPYIPMLSFILRGELSYKNRDVFLFENKPISYALCFDALSEESTVHGVVEAVQLHLGTSSTANNLTICGHSFGSVSLTWMIRSPDLKNRVRSMILLDPVSILLSEPDVVVNFLYSRQDIPTSYSSNGWLAKVIRFVNETKINLVASSEMFIEYYLRRSFAWYNSELWLQDIPANVKVAVCLAENDEIINASKIGKELDLHNAKVSRGACGGASVEQLVWRDVGHAHCVMNPERWSDVHHFMKKIEANIRKETSTEKSQ